MRTFKEFNEDRILSEAAGVTFYALLAIFPAVAAFVSVYALFLDPATIAAHVTAAGSFLPGGATDVIGGQVTRIAAHGASTLGVSFLVGLATALWSASAGMKALMGALNIVYDEKEKRGFFKLAGVALALTIGAMAFVVLAVITVVGVPIILRFVGLGAIVEWLIVIVRWPLIAGLLALALAVLYRFGPSRDQPQWRWVTWGSAVAALLWVVVSGLSRGMSPILDHTTRPTARWGRLWVL